MKFSITAPLEEEKPSLERETGLIQSLRLRLVSQIGYWAILLIGKTLRWEVEGWENHRRIVDAGKRIIYTFWHGRIFTSTYFWRSRGIAVMTSMNRDGDYIARVINRFGYLAPRGSSSRGGTRALAEMMRVLRNNRDVGLTIDGPLGPRYIAKPGAIWLASKSGGAVFPFHISAKYKWIFSSWDRFEIPRPFSPVLVLMGEPIFVDKDAGTEELARKQYELQGSLEDLLKRGDSHWADASNSAH